MVPKPGNINNPINKEIIIWCRDSDRETARFASKICHGKPCKQHSFCLPENPSFPLSADANCCLPVSSLYPPFYFPSPDPARGLKNLSLSPAAAAAASARRRRLGFRREPEVAARVPLGSRCHAPLAASRTPLLLSSQPEAAAATLLTSPHSPRGRTGRPSCSLPSPCAHSQPWFHGSRFPSPFPAAAAGRCTPRPL